MLNLLRLWFGVREPVGRANYAASGFSLMIAKYAVEALVIWFLSNKIYWPWDFLNPVYSLRTEMLGGAGPAAQVWAGLALAIWSLPFLWIAISMSVRRAADAGLSPWLGLLVIIPLVNLSWMPALCFLPHSEKTNWQVKYVPASHENIAQDAALAIGASVIAGGVVMFFLVYFIQAYGAALFVGTPLMMGMVASYVFNQKFSRGYWSSILLGLGSIACGAVALLLFALEGVICVAMAVPILAPLGLLGGLLGKMIADTTRRPTRELFAIVAILPGLAWVEALVVPATEYEVVSAVVIDAPPDVVWEHVIAFPELPPPTEWYFRGGIACPMRARIEGSGVGAIRYCEFTTGVFVEPVTAWEPSQRLAFNVTGQPHPMFELTPYKNVHPPHLDGTLRSNRGEFRLIALPDGRTRLEGSTWYEIDMFPQSYWTLWSHDLIHRIHLRVLKHVKRTAETRGNA